jgi:purine nucleoside permease
LPIRYHLLRYNPDLQVLGIVTGEGKSHAAASVMGLGMDPRFDLSKAYDLAADTFWIGDLLNSWAENWISYWTVGQGSFAMGDFEDAGVGQALQFLSQAGRADQNRLLVLRAGSDYTVQPKDQTPAQFLASENSGGLSGFTEALNDLYLVGSIVVKNLSANWSSYANQIPSPASLHALPTLSKN